MHRAPLLHRKHGGCSNAEQDPHESCHHHQELHAVTGVQVTEQSYTHRRLAECACVPVCVCVMERVWAAWTGPEQSGGGGAEWLGGAGQDLDPSGVSSALTLKPLTRLYASSPPDYHWRGEPWVYACACLGGDTWMWNRIWGLGLVKGSEQMELLTSLIIMAGAAEGTSAGGRWHQGGLSQVPASRCD